jgi:hypothetical protein
VSLLLVPARWSTPLGRFFNALASSRATVVSIDLRPVKARAIVATKIGRDVRAGADAITLFDNTTSESRDSGQRGLVSIADYAHGRFQNHQPAR